MWQFKERGGKQECFSFLFKTTTEVKINFLNDVTKYGHTCDNQRPEEGLVNKSSSLTGT
jgi:hypothetical protein